MSKDIRIALTGNPNSGKTTLYNALTGRTEKVGNWAGVTVAMKESNVKSSFYKGDNNLIAVDLPGAYSMSPFTTEESITKAYIASENANVIINIVDATNLSRSLFFTTQLLELGIPVVVALNKSDLNKKKDIEINVDSLSALLGCPVIETISTNNSNNGLEKVVEKAVELAFSTQKAPYNQPKIDIKNKEEVATADKARFDFVNDIVAKVEKRKEASNVFNKQDKFDSIVTNKWLGVPIFALVMFVVFFISQSLLGPIIADLLVGWIETFGEFIGGLLEEANPFLTSLLVDGIIGGVGAVVGFLPLVMVMYFLIALLEDCGYMARVATVMDPIFKRVGLSGKSIIPMVIGTGCAIPGIMACRTIKNEREKRATAMLTPFVPCGAKLPVIALFAAVFFAESALVATAMYFLSIGIIIGAAFIIKLVTAQKYRKSFFIMELPEYKAPSPVKACQTMLSRALAFIIKAGTIILICNAVVHIMGSFDWSLQLIEEGMEDTSILASLSKPFAYLLVPFIGIVSWQLAAAAITGFIAKENVVGTIAVVFAITNFIDPEEFELVGGASSVADAMGISSAGALAYLLFILFTPPCFAAIGAMNSEMKSKKWLFAGIGLQFAVAFVVSFVVYQVGSLFTSDPFNLFGTLFGLVVVALIVTGVIFLIKKGNKSLEDYSLSN